jgi:hypothetical protein
MSEFEYQHAWKIFFIFAALVMIAGLMVIKFGLFRNPQDPAENSQAPLAGNPRPTEPRQGDFLTDQHKAFTCGVKAAQVFFSSNGAKAIENPYRLRRSPGERALFSAWAKGYLRCSEMHAYALTEFEQMQVAFNFGSQAGREYLESGKKAFIRNPYANGKTESEIRLCSAWLEGFNTYRDFDDENRTN